MKHYSQEHKQSAIAKMMPPHNMRVSQLAEETGISEQSLYSWRQKAREEGFKHFILPKENAKEAAIVNDVEILGVDNILEVINHFNKERKSYNHPNNTKNIKYKVRSCRSFCMYITYHCS